jgi:hypothetical protein
MKVSHVSFSATAWIVGWFREDKYEKEARGSPKGGLRLSV